MYSRGKYEQAARALQRISNMNSSFSGLAPIQNEAIFPGKRSKLKNYERQFAASAASNGSIIDDLCIGPANAFGELFKNILYLFFSAKYAWTVFFLFCGWFFTSYANYGNFNFFFKFFEFF